MGRRGTWSAVDRARAGRFRQGVAPAVTADRRGTVTAVDSAIGAAFTGITRQVAAVGGRPRRGRGIHPRPPASVHSGFCYIYTRRHRGHRTGIFARFKLGYIRLARRRIRHPGTLDIRASSQLARCLSTRRPIETSRNSAATVNATRSGWLHFANTNYRGVSAAIFFKIICRTTIC